MISLFMPLTAANLWWCEIFNNGHTILFFVSFVLYYWLNATFPFSNTAIMYLIVLVAGLLLDIAVDMLQGLLQREVSIDDLYRNFLNIILPWPGITKSSEEAV